MKRENELHQIMTSRSQNSNDVTSKGVDATIRQLAKELKLVLSTASWRTSLISGNPPSLITATPKHQLIIYPHFTIHAPAANLLVSPSISPATPRASTGVSAAGCMCSTVIPGSCSLRRPRRDGVALAGTLVAAVSDALVVMDARPGGSPAN